MASAAEQDRVLADLREQTRSAAAPRPENLAMSRDEVRSLAGGGLVGVGAHTVTHPVLSAIEPAQAASEIAQSKKDVEGMIGGSVSSFAYPFGYRGAYTEANIGAVRAAGMSDACSNFGGTVRASADPYQLNRILVRDWDVERFARTVRWAFGD
jgi:peptidoglycan/xylan/chitin deacetylase (PgdA/CDA1 family)